MIARPRFAGEEGSSRPQPFRPWLRSSAALPASRAGAAGRYSRPMSGIVRRRTAVVVGVVSLLAGMAGACGLDSEVSGRRDAVAADPTVAVAAQAPTAGPTPTIQETQAASSTAPSNPLPAAAPTEAPTSAPDPASVPGRTLQQDLCERPDPIGAGSLEEDDIVEASGITRSTSHDGWWVHNDGGRPELFAVGVDGADLGTILLEDVDLWDVEDMTSWERNGQRELLLADIGDNRLRQGGEHPLVVIAEPLLGSDSVRVRTVLLRYPDGPHNAEVLLADEATGQIIIITKEEDPEVTVQPVLLPAQIFVGALTSEAEVVDLQLAGTIDIAALSDSSPDTQAHPFAAVGRAGVFTGGEVSPDGSAIALRTYGTVWVWDRAMGASVAEALLGTPCEANAPFELQGEALGFSRDDGWLAVGEGRNVELWLSAAPGNDS